MKMTRESYREHMRRYSKDTMVMSFVVTKHPSYQVLLAAGSDIIQYLLEDLLDPNWHCSHCYGEGFEFPPDWVWDNEKRNWPSDTGIPCTECKGKGSINSWACMMLLSYAAGSDRPKVPDWMRGRHEPLTNLWREWGEDRGYLPMTPRPAPEPNIVTKLLRAVGLLS
jgi:hypothetical protein